MEERGAAITVGTKNTEVGWTNQKKRTDRESRSAFSYLPDEPVSRDSKPLPTFLHCALGARVVK